MQGLIAFTLPCGGDFQLGTIGRSQLDLPKTQAFQVRSIGVVSAKNHPTLE